MSAWAKAQAFVCADIFNIKLTPRKKMKTHTMFGLVCATLLCSLTVHANEQTALGQTGFEIAQPDPQQIEFMQPVSSDKLSSYRGGASITNSEMTLSGLTAGNTAVNVVSGTNWIGSGAFANMSGLPLVVQNSGANVLIQNAVILNLQMN
jgi:hypothetical protein